MTSINKNYTDNLIKETTKVLNTFPNKPITINSISSGVISDIPVLLATLMVELSINHLIELPENAISINSIKNNIVLTSCKFLKESSVLFLNGFIRKKIYYASKAYKNLRYYKIDIPFKCTTTVILDKSKASQIVNNNNKANVKPSEKNKILSDTLDFNKVFDENFDKQPFCELISSKITENCKYVYIDNKGDFIKPLTIREITHLDSNMSIVLEIQILKNKQVYINPYFNTKQKLSPNNSKYLCEKKNTEASDIDSTTPTVKEKNLLLIEKESSKINKNKSYSNKTDIVDKPSVFDKFLESNNNHKLDLDYLLNFYNEPYDEHDVKDKSNIYDKTDLSNIYNNNYYKNNTKYNSDNIYYSNNYKATTYKISILILCIFIFCNMNNHNIHL